MPRETLGQLLGEADEEESVGIDEGRVEDMGAFAGEDVDEVAEPKVEGSSEGTGGITVMDDAVGHPILDILRGGCLSDQLDGGGVVHVREHAVRHVPGRRGEPKLFLSSWRKSERSKSSSDCRRGSESKSGNELRYVSDHC